MGGGSKSSSSSSSTSNTTYKDTTTDNPYVKSRTTNGGTTTTLKPGTALSSVYNFTNANMDELLNRYLNPSIDNNPTAQAQLNAYRRTLNDETRKNLENNIIAPLSQRNMIRSSQATDLYNNLAKQTNDAISDYTTNLLANSQNDTANIITNLMNYALQGYNVVSGNQAQSLNTSSGNASKQTNSSGSSSSVSYGM